MQISSLESGKKQVLLIMLEALHLPGFSLRTSSRFFALIQTDFRMWLDTMKAYLRLNRTSYGLIGILIFLLIAAGLRALYRYSIP